MIDSRLRHLELKFTKFRSGGRSRRRIPDDLRREVLAAVKSGVSRARVAATLRLSYDQIRDWQRGQQQQPKPAVQRARILDVFATPALPGLPAGLRISYEGGRLLLELFGRG